MCEDRAVEMYSVAEAVQLVGRNRHWVISKLNLQVEDHGHFNSPPVET